MNAEIKKTPKGKKGLFPSTSAGEMGKRKGKVKMKTKASFRQHTR
jgi:hypothetical protein